MFLLQFQLEQWLCSQRLSRNNITFFEKSGFQEKNHITSAIYYFTQRKPLEQILWCDFSLTFSFLQ